MPGTKTEMTPHSWYRVIIPGIAHTINSTTYSLQRLVSTKYSISQLIVFTPGILIEMPGLPTIHKYGRIMQSPRTSAAFAGPIKTRDAVRRASTERNSDELGKSACAYASSTSRKTYGSVDRELVWVVLASFGVPKMSIGIRQFHEGMRARVGT